MSSTMLKVCMNGGKGHSAIGLCTPSGSMIIENPEGTGIRHIYAINADKTIIQLTNSGFYYTDTLYITSGNAADFGWPNLSGGVLFGHSRQFYTGVLNSPSGYKQLVYSEGQNPKVAYVPPL